MAHYGTLRDYHFSADVDDIRGAEIYAADQSKLGKVKDVIFDHDTGEIRYLVADLGHNRRVLIPSDHVFRSVVDEDSFGTDLTRNRAASMPEFDEKMLESERDWQKHEDELRKHWHKREEKLEEEYDKGWHAAPVQHRHGTDRNITPEPDDEPPASGERIVTGADLTPHRIAGKFPGDRGPMVVPGSTNSEITLRPEGTIARAEDAAWKNVPPGPRWTSFQEHLRSRMTELRQRCGTCCNQRRVA